MRRRRGWVVGGAARDRHRNLCGHRGAWTCAANHFIHKVTIAGSHLDVNLNGCVGQEETRVVPTLMEIGPD